MHIQSLHLRGYRNHHDTRVELAPHINLITGPNGAGKTSLIDAIHYLSMSRSFVSASDQYVANNELKYFMISGIFSGRVRSEFKIGCNYSRSEGKRIFVNDSPLDRFSDLIGQVPVVVLSPDDMKLTSEGPSQRRQFLDSMISQISKPYLHLLISYHKIRRQRNRLLQEFRGSHSRLAQLLEPWNVQICKTGAAIIRKRADVLEQFQNYLLMQYQTLTGLSLRPSLTYQTILSQPGSVEEIEQEYSRLLEENFEREAERGLTLIGPHRDEILFYLDGMELRKYGSQGQHRLFSMSLKMGQLFYYTDELEDLPIMLLDDLFGNLDQNKTNTILETLNRYAGQTFITSATELPFDQILFQDNNNNAWFRVENGNVTTKRT